LYWLCFRKCIQRISNLGSPDYNIFDGIIDASEPRYCICDQVSFGTMVACDNKAVCWIKIIVYEKKIISALNQ